MKFETAMLHTFFAASVLTCLLMLGAFVASPTTHVASAAAFVVADR
ncbi:hypothetical protein [Luteibacter rhizovicinus]|jgi:hypothetical protein|nr:hypothetical protein [Luteibacter rhizovicinus]